MFILSILILSLVYSLEVLNKFNLTWTTSNSHIKFTLYQSINKGYIGLGLKSPQGDSSMSDSDIWVFDLENHLVSDHHSKDNSFPNYDYKNSLQSVEFSQDGKIIEWTRKMLTKDFEDIEITLDKYKLLWCIGRIVRGKISQHLYGDAYRGVVLIDIRNP
ncbi:hypothetical protein SteCoe_33014 [Stentor coeruleus]|uniref:DOMON domain-containing protein n=1 Tax=Stentor coeruleus TaxID=5963 RepID=A0A1R2AXM6_9CILI|nr:hypothetical protein SteCoe_33014 [Stentor coeruleus]